MSEVEQVQLSIDLGQLDWYLLERDRERFLALDKRFIELCVYRFTFISYGRSYDDRLTMFGDNRYALNVINGHINWSTCQAKSHS